MAKKMERRPKSSICSLAHGSLADGGSTVDSHLMALFRPHFKPPSAILPVGTYTLPFPQGSTHVRSCRQIHDLHAAPHSPSLLLVCTSDDALLTFDMNAGAFFSEIEMSAGHSWAASPRSASCVHVNRYPGTPLVFAGSLEGDVLVFDIRISSLNAKFSGRKDRPTLRIPAAHDGALCGIRTGVANHPHLFITGGREDRWLRLFDLRFPFHYSSGSSRCQSLVPYPLEATRLGPTANEHGFRNCFMAFDVSPDGSLLAASVTRCHSFQPPGIDRMMDGADGETVLLSLSDGAHALKTIASADACAAEFIQFSSNGKYVLQTGGVKAAHCRMCWRCACSCACVPETCRGCLNLSDGATTRRGQSCVSNFNGGGENTLAAGRVGGERNGGDMPSGNGPVRHQSPHAQRCLYHRAQLVNIVQSNRTISLKSPADGAIAFADSFCLSHSPRESHPQPAAGAEFCLSASTDVCMGSCGQPLALVAAGNSDLLRLLNFTLHGPLSGYAKRSRQRFWDYLTRVQKHSVGVSASVTQASSGSACQLTGCVLQSPGMTSGERRTRDSAKLPECGNNKPPIPETGGSANVSSSMLGEVAATQVVGAGADELHAASKSLLFPLLHPQLSQFVAACGPLHPGFARAEAATFPFTCRLWGGLVVGFGGSTADYSGCRRLYEGLKLWDSTTGVVLSWTEGYLVRAAISTLRAIFPYFLSFECDTLSTKINSKK